MATRRKSSSEGAGGPAPPPHSETGGAGEWELLLPFLSEERHSRILDVLENRTDRLVLVLDGLCDPHNLSAILRTAEAFGLQRVILTGSVPKGLNPQVALGAQRWLTVRREPDARALLERLKASGYEVAASVLAPDAIPLEHYRPAGPVALVLGNEHEGISTPWLEGSDVRLTIPLKGFVRSLNVSVAAGIFIARLISHEQLSSGGLDASEAEHLKNLWARLSVERSDQILKEVRSRKKGR